MTSPWEKETLPSEPAIFTRYEVSTERDSVVFKISEEKGKTVTIAIPPREASLIGEQIIKYAKRLLTKVNA